MTEHIGTINMLLLDANLLNAEDKKLKLHMYEIFYFDYLLFSFENNA